ncbi:serine protein kinase RIO [Candidatus Woesearchaeota archaeon]|nr:serine protein kinase RIO [Candidatus Woesearchaeota archaeon]
MVTLTYQERFKTAKGVFDESTERNLFELQSRGFFDRLLSPWRIGKESNVFIAEKAHKTVIIKIYRVQNCDFKRMYNYIRKDRRYEYLKNKRRDIIFSWAQREYKNLFRAKKAHLNAPSPIAWRCNILVEEMIGDQEPAPQLKDAQPKKPLKFFNDIIHQMGLLYQNGLIHGDLSSFNLLNYQEKPYFIDFSQATLTNTPNSEELLERDIKNILAFFISLGVKADFKETFKKITGKN